MYWLLWTHSKVYNPSFVIHCPCLLQAFLFHFILFIEEAERNESVSLSSLFLILALLENFTFPFIDKAERDGFLFFIQIEYIFCEEKKNVWVYLESLTVTNVKNTVVKVEHKNTMK